ncbi:MAG TPA: F0F1 ATP synthase subunit delta [Chitinophagaceae bacterium]|nr:F0F1 ATP synthase subunit delta [Chitinophagaceae bacterium]HRX92782.1 F0F1 ATP synthase subunit delta [Chitinophagaceae bacterium]
MLINWFTVIAQIINFLILVALLKHFLYKPILKAIDEREKKIVAQIEDANKREADATQLQQEFIEKNKAFNQERNKLMNTAIQEANNQRQQLLEDAKTEAQALRKKLEENLKENQEHFNSEMIRRTRQEVFAISKKALKDLANSSLEDQMIEVFIKRLNECSEEEKKKLSSTLAAGVQPAVVKSVFELNETQKEKIRSALRSIQGSTADIRFDTSPDLVSGIELTANGFSISWSIADYLDSVERNIDELMNTQPGKKNEQDNENSGV